MNMEYKIIFEYSLEETEEAVTQALSEGWEIVGSLVVLSGSGYYREMVRKSDKLKTAEVEFDKDKLEVFLNGKQLTPAIGINVTESDTVRMKPLKMSERIKGTIKGKFTFPEKTNGGAKTWK